MGDSLISKCCCGYGTKQIQKERTFSDILLLTPRSISMLSHSVTPIAYKSLKTLAQAILPCKAATIRSEPRRLKWKHHGTLPSCRGHLRWGRYSLLSGPEKGLHVWGEWHTCPCLCLQWQTKLVFILLWAQCIVYLVQRSNGQKNK